MVKCLENEGVSVVFGLPGEENIRFVFQALHHQLSGCSHTGHDSGRLGWKPSA